MSFAVMSFYKYISKRLYDQSCMLCIQIINIMEMYCGVSTSPPPLVACDAQRSEEHLIAMFSQLAQMNEIYLRR